MSLWAILTLATLARVGLIVFAHWQDAHMDVKYTDVDYAVFTNASRHVIAGASPYAEPTYRYTPLVAYALLPNAWWADWGKALFSTADLIAAWFIYRIVRANGGSRCDANRAVGIWLFNPLTLVVSSRGNAESLIAVVVLAGLHSISTGQLGVGAVLHGLAVHLKVYPIIYTPVMLLSIAGFRLKKEKDLTLSQPVNGVIRVVGSLRCWKFGVTSTLTFLVLLWSFYRLYGWKFVFETYLYHMSRIDSQHNFSPYFYPFHLLLGTGWEDVLKSVVFIPQFLFILYFSFAHSHDLPYSCFMSTFAFVSWNKVCTSQYFLWYLTLLPLVVHKMTPRKSLVKLVLFWLLSQANWLFWAYLLEFQQLNVRPIVGLSSLAFLCVNMYIMIVVCWMYDSDIKKS